MRALHVADTHLGRTTHSTPGTTSRSDDLGATLLRFADVAVEEKVDLALLPGDLFHGRRPVPKDLLYLTEALAKLRKAKILALLSGGNHDGTDTVGDERTHALAWLNALAPDGVRMFTNAKATTLRLDNGQAFNIVATPYPHKRAFDALMPEMDPDERVEWISRAYEKSVDTMIDSVQAGMPDLPTIFMGHVSVVGATLGSEVSMRFGWDVTVGSGVFDKVDYAALGHIHRQQQISEKCWYSGSPEFLDFGEAGQTKGFLLVDIQKGKNPKVEVIDSSPRPMATVSLTETDSGWQYSPEAIAPGAIIKLDISPLVSVSPGDVLRFVREVRVMGASYVSHRVILPERVAIARAQMSAEVEVEQALRSWLEAAGYSDVEMSTVLRAGMDLVNELGAR